MKKAMAVEKLDQTFFEGDSGGYYVCSNSEACLFAGKLLLHPLGFAPPHYGDSSKICFVLEGTTTIGLVTPNREEKVLLIQKGDVLPVSAGQVTWWFNGGNTDAVIILFAETSKALVPGNISYFLLAGVLGTLAGFQPDFVGKIFGLDQRESKNVVTSQKGALLFKLGSGIKFPEPSNDHSGHILLVNVYHPSGKVIFEGSGSVSTLTEKNFPMLGEVGLSARFVKLEGNAMLAPSYVADGSIQICYIAKGSGRIKVVGSQGKLELDSNVQEGDLFIVPQFFATAAIADDAGLEVFSVITSSKPVFEQLAGNTSIWTILSPVVLQASLNITPDSEQLFKSKNSKNMTIVPPRT